MRLKLLREKWRDFKYGIKFHYPFCCIVAYVLGYRGKGRIIIQRNLDDVYIPCPFHRKNGVTVATFVELVELAWKDLEEEDEIAMRGVW